MRRDPNKPKGVFLVPYIREHKLLYKVRATYRGPAIKDLADGFKSADAAKKWYTKFLTQDEPPDSRERFLADLASIPGVTVARY